MKEVLVLFFWFLPLLGIISGCQECENCGPVFNEPQVTLEFINQDSLIKVDDSLARLNSYDQGITLVQNTISRQINFYTSLRDSLVLQRLNIGEVFTLIEQRNLRATDSLIRTGEALAVQVPSDSVRDLMIKNRLSLNLQTTLSASANQLQDQLSDLQGFQTEPVNQLLIELSAASESCRTLRNQWNRLRNRLNNVRSNINNGKIRVDSVMGIGSNQILTFHNNLRDSLTSFQFPLNMNSDESVFVVFIRQQRDTFSLTYQRELVESEGRVSVGANQIEIADHTFKELLKICETQACENGRTTFTAFF